MDCDLYILRCNANLRLDALEQETDQPFLRFGRPSGEHADLDDRVVFASVIGIDEVLGVHGEKAMESLRFRQAERVDEAGMNGVR